MKLKSCARCKKSLPLSKFFKDNQKSSKLTSLCKSCMMIYRAKYVRNNIEKIRKYGRDYNFKDKDRAKNWKLKFDHGITLDVFKEMLIKQNNKCSICKRSFTNKVKPCVDHNHETKKIRDLLCPSCNFLLGNCNESTLVLKKAINYLMKWRDILN